MREPDAAAPAGPRARALLEQARAICSCLAAAFALRGLFGVDFIWDGERAWTHEVNPRPTASLEALESAYGLGVFDAHLRGCAGELPRVEPQRSRAAGKAVVFATEGDGRRRGLEGVRDVPHPGERIAAGRPICTVVATAATPEAVLAGLEAQAARLRCVGVPALTCAGCGCVCDDGDARVRSATRGSRSASARRWPASRAAR